MTRTRPHGLWLPALCAMAITALLSPSTAGPVPPETVTLVKSSELAEYEQAVNGLADAIGEGGTGTVLEQHSLESGAGQDFWRRIDNGRPQVLVTVGTRATRGALEFCREKPVVFTMVLDRIHRQAGQAPVEDIAGVVLDIPVARQLEQLKQVLPDTRRVGYIYGPDMEETHREAVAAAEDNGMRLLAEKVLSERDIPDALRRLITQVDAFWMPPDPMMYEDHVFRFVVLECFKNGVPIVSVYRSRAEAGIPIAIGVDYEDIGRQTAELVLRRLRDGRFVRPEIIHPRKLLIYINEGVASSLNLNIPDNLPLVPVRSGS